MCTVVICCYNGEHFLSRCLDSLAEQKAPNLQTIIVDDASTDGSLEIMRQYKESLPVCTIIQHESNQGLVASCNDALAQVTTPFFMRLDADDSLPQGAMDIVRRALREPIPTDFFLFSRWDAWPSSRERVTVESDIFQWVATGTVFRTDAVRAVGGYHEGQWEEYDLYLRLLESGCTYRTSPEITYVYERGHQSMTSDEQANRKGFEWLVRTWGYDTLRKYGDIEMLQKYYSKI